MEGCKEILSEMTTRKKVMLVALILIVVILLTGLIVASIFFTMNQFNSTESTNNATVTQQQFTIEVPFSDNDNW
jgi:flagellar basal body-associated protein FliL